MKQAYTGWAEGKVVHQKSKLHQSSSVCVRILLTNAHG